MAPTGADAEELMQAKNFDLIVLDLGLPDIDGLELVHKIRHRKKLWPILILTARDCVTDRIEAIKQGADDYLTKPFELKELEVRSHCLLRRCYGSFCNDMLGGRLEVNSLQRQISIDGEPIALAGREYCVLELLLSHAGKVVSKEKIAQRLSLEGGAQSDNAIDIYIHRLRKRIEPYGLIIRTVRGLGYFIFWRR